MKKQWKLCDPGDVPMMAVVAYSPIINTKIQFCYGGVEVWNLGFAHYFPFAAISRCIHSAKGQHWERWRDKPDIYNFYNPCDGCTEIRDTEGLYYFDAYSTVI